MVQKISIPKEVPDVILKTRIRDESLKGDNPFRWHDTHTKELFKGKRIVLFSIPGAFTPTCSSKHLPGYEKRYDELKELGVDEVYCISVNDSFVMFQWGKAHGIKNVKLLPDGSGNFTRAMGMIVKKNNLGFGERSWRYSMFIDRGKIENMFIEPGLEDDCSTDPFEVSDVNTMIEYLKSK